MEVGKGRIIELAEQSVVGKLTSSRDSKRPYPKTKMESDGGRHDLNLWPPPRGFHMHKHMWTYNPGHHPSGTRD